MIKVAAWCQDPSDATLRQLTQLGVDCVDALPLPTDERGVFDLDEALKMKKRVHSWGLQVNRISLPGLSKRFMDEEDGAEEELDVACESVRVLGEAGYPLGRVHFDYSTDPWMIGRYRASHRGGYPARGDSLSLAEGDEPPDIAVREQRWETRLCGLRTARAYRGSRRRQTDDASLRSTDAGCALWRAGIPPGDRCLSESVCRLPLLLRDTRGGRRTSTRPGRDSQLRAEGTSL